MTRNTRCMLAAALFWATRSPALAQEGMTPQQAQQPSATGKKSKPQQGSKQELQVRGKVSEVWKTPVESTEAGDNTVVMLETERGQLIAADLGPSEQLEAVEIEEGTPVMIWGAVVDVRGEPYFMAEQIQVGERAIEPPKAPAPAKRPEKQQVSGKIVGMREMGAKMSAKEHELVVVEVGPQKRMLVDLGPASQLDKLDLEEGKQVRVEGIKLRINDRSVLMAHELSADGKNVEIQRKPMPQQQGQPPQ